MTTSSEDEDDREEESDAEEASDEALMPWDGPTWVRLPSEETDFSDWQIDVKLHGNSEVTSYSVHRYKIGPRSSYFKSIFCNNGSFIESNTKRSQIEFPENLPICIGRDEFELFLEYLYGRPGDNDNSNSFFFWHHNGSKHYFKRRHAVPLLYLSDYFGVNDLWQKFLKGGEYYPEVYHFADLFSMQQLKTDVENRSYYDYLAGYVIRQLPNPELKQEYFNATFLNRLETGNFKTVLGGNSFDKMVIDVIDRSPEVVGPSFFNKFRKAVYNKKVVLSNLLMGDHLLKFLQHEQRLCLDDPESDNLTWFQKECIRCIVEYLKRDRYSSYFPKLDDYLQNLKPAIQKALSTNY